MTLVLLLLLANAVIGAFDTLWYHEYRGRLPHHLDITRPELRLHAARDAIYVVVYGVLAFGLPTGWPALLFGGLLAAEITITLADFVIEDRDRPALGGMPAGERVAHTAMAIVYGAMLATLVPELVDAVGAPTGFEAHGAPAALRWAMLVATAGIAVTGLRDGLALAGYPIDLTAELTQRRVPPAYAPTAGRFR